MSCQTVGLCEIENEYSETYLFVYKKNQTLSSRSKIFNLDCHS